MVWQRPPRKSYNTFSVVVKTEEEQWVSFVDGGEAGTKILKRGETKREIISEALKYMREFP